MTNIQGLFAPVVLGRMKNMNCCIVKRCVTLKSFLPLFLIAALSVLLAFASAFIFAFIPFLILIIGMGVIIYLVPSVINTEYEYNLEGDTFSIAIVKNNAFRKELFSCDMNYLVSCSPFDEADFVSTRNKINAYVKGKTAYYAVFTQDEQTAAVTFSPSEDFIKSMRLIAPLKVKINIL